ncbi:hypothetical protein CB1_000678016 [Camelus ferus]|nr:hypothetical protein CB1_000678016 [Camelus ferus]
MASRPFASVDVALEVGVEQADFLRGSLESSSDQVSVKSLPWAFMLVSVHLPSPEEIGTLDRHRSGNIVDRFGFLESSPRAY